MNNIRAIIFDFDGTLFHTNLLGERTLKKVCETLNLPDVQYEFRQLSGIPHIEKIRRLFPGNHQAIDLWKKLYYDTFFDEIKPYDGIKEILYELKRNSLKLCIYSTRKEEEITCVLKKFNFLFFDGIAGLGGQFKPKPDPEAIFYYLKLFNLGKKELLLIGDSNVDYEAAINSGILFGFATWGTKSLDKIETFHVKFDKVEDMQELM